MTDTRPRITFKDGVCNACQYSDYKQTVNWKQREEEFLDLVMPLKGKGPYDCVVPFSGGKDSASIAYRLKFKYGLKPLLATYGQLLWTECGQRNFNRVCEMGFDIDYHRVDQRVSRHLTRRFFIERGHPKLHYDAGVNSCPVRTALMREIPVIFYAEHGESEYGGHIMDEEARRTRNLDEVLEHIVGDSPYNWVDDVVDERDIYPYLYPDDVSGITAYYWSYFFPWSVWENYQLMKEGWSLAPNDRSDGSFEGWDSIDDKIDGLDFYLMWIKFKFGRCTRIASRLVKENVLTREQGLEYCEKYDGEFPTTYLQEVLDYMSMDMAELRKTIDSHRNPELWSRNENGLWV